MDSIGLSRQIKITSIIGRVPPDYELAIRARSLLRWKIRYNSIHVEAENGHLILSGEVDSSSDRDAAEQTIRRLTGVVGVTNRISTTSLRLRRLQTTNSVPSTVFKESLLEGSHRRKQ